MLTSLEGGVGDDAAEERKRRKRRREKRSDGDEEPDIVPGSGDSGGV